MFRDTEEIRQCYWLDSRIRCLFKIIVTSTMTSVLYPKNSANNRRLRHNGTVIASRTSVLTADRPAANFSFQIRLETYETEQWHP